jgi:hypothetical protein
MGLLLILAQVTLVVLDYGAHVTRFSPWVVFLPAILLVTCYVLATVLGCIFMLDSFTAPFAKRPRKFKNRK